MRTIGIDFESTWHRGERDAQTFGPYIYLAHDETEIYLVSISTPDFDWVGHPHDAPWYDIIGDDVEWVSHNRTFDMAAFLVVAEAIDFPLEHVPEWRCSADLAALLGVKRDLANAAKFLLEEEVDKDPRARTNGKDAETIMSGVSKEEMDAYAIKDAQLTRRIWEEWGDQMSEHERWLSMHTTYMALEGIALDVDFVEEHLTRLNQEVFELEKQLPWTAMENPKVPKKRRGECYSPTSRSGIFAYCELEGLPRPKSLAKDSPAFDAWVAEHGEAATWAKALQQYRSADRTRNLLDNLHNRYQSWGESVIPYGLKYHGAVTGRYSGDGGFNMQNMSRDERNGVKIRHAFVPRVGYKFVICDLSQIEARVLLWEAGDFEQLHLIAEGMDVYEAHARTTMGYKHEGALKDVDPKLRHYAKMRVLGLGYAAGAKTFQEYAWKVGGLDLSMKEAKKIVSEYRKSNKAITRYWKSLEQRVIRGARRNDGDHYEELPSGRFLCYRGVKKDRGYKAETTLGGGHRYFHPGLLAENRVSAISRDIMSYAIRAIEEELDLRVVLHIHDEVVVEVPEYGAEAHQAEIESVMRRRPEWAQDLPIDCESDVRDRYDK